MNFVPCIAWIKKGVAKSIPDKVKLNEEELQSIIERTTQDIEDVEESEEEGGMEAEVTTGNGQDEYGFENYDQEKEDPDAVLNLANVAVFASIANDPDVTVPNDSDEEADSENEDNEIHPDDNLILAGHVDGDMGILDVYVYNEEKGYLYVHHDLMLSALPLCFEWLNHEPGGGAGNLVAVGSMSPIIEVWDVDIVDCLEAAFKLGQRASKKKKRKAKGHTKAVLDMAWNKNFSHVLASGSADETVLLWDLDSGEINTRLTPFTAPVQALQWHPTQSHGLLTGCCDKVVRLFDCRSDSEFLEWTLPGEVERVAWNHLDPFYCLASTDCGSVHCFDVRTQAQLWEIKEHTKEVTGLALSCSCPGLMVTGSTDGRLLVWDIQGSVPEIVVEKQVSVGAIHCVRTSPDCPFAVSIGGDSKENNFTVWHMEDNQKVRDRFSNRPLAQPMSAEEEMATDDASASFQDMNLAGPSTSQGASKKKHKKKK